jgi:hypothetical protein
MSRSGVIKRADTGMFISLDDIHVKEGFNKRDDDERTRLADDALFEYLMNGGTVPPLEVTPVMKAVFGLLKVTAVAAAMNAAVMLVNRLIAFISCHSLAMTLSAWLVS